MMGNTPQLETSVGALRIPGFQGPGWSMARMGQEPLNEGRKGTVIRHAAFPWWFFFPHLREGKLYHPLCHQTSNSTFRSSLSAADLTHYSLEKRAAFRGGDFISAPAHSSASLRMMLASAKTKGLVPPFAPVLSHCGIISPVFCRGIFVHCAKMHCCDRQNKKLYGQSLGRTSCQRRDNRGVQETPLRRRMSRAHKMGGR